MTDNSKKHHRLSIRLKGYDYSTQSAYFVTICTKNRQCIFGDVVNRAMELTEHGRTVATCWAAIPQHFPNVALDASMVMPNHFHGILIIGEPHRRGAACRAPTTLGAFGPPIPGALSTIVRSFKAAATKRINELRGTPGLPVWQRNFYERIIRNEDDLIAIRRYILDNPPCWAEDEDNPARIIRG